MQIDLTNLPAQGERVEETFGPDDLIIVGRRKRVPDITPVSATLRAWIRPEATLVRATGEVEGEGSAECDRCLKAVRVPIKTAFDQRYSWEGTAAPRPSGGHDEEVALAEDELDIVSLEGSAFDTAELAREQFVLATPIRVVCIEDCKGLCPDCGADLNAGPCACAPETGDPRWDALKKLKTDIEGSGDPDSR